MVTAHETACWCWQSNRNTVQMFKGLRAHGAGHYRKVIILHLWIMQNMQIHLLSTKFYFYSNQNCLCLCVIISLQNKMYLFPKIFPKSHWVVRNETHNSIVVEYSHKEFIRAWRVKVAVSWALSKDVCASKKSFSVFKMSHSVLSIETQICQI